MDFFRHIKIDIEISDFIMYIKTSGYFPPGEIFFI